MDYEEMNYQSLSSRQREWNSSLAFSALMRKVYVWMSLALVITALAAYGVATNPVMTEILLSNPVLMWGIVGAELLLVIGLGAGVNKMSLTVATTLFIVYSILNGVMLSSIFFIYSLGSITTVFLITASTFGVMSLYGYVTQKDLTSWGRLLMMALIGLIIATIVNVFVASPGLTLIASYVGVLVFVGLTAYDTQRIKQMFLTAPDAGEHMQKYALLGALNLYLDFVNLFLYLLRIFGKRE
ncbi:Bax inhibitor-1/YccA family protein [Prevotella sp. E13-17]|uniref:Bax inhibitor-1/YccA family protein n=1 Tax=Prevotella sp. E13-17 TaxID=2913616 RepID=UPI001EDC27F4|nr:Bax inhibitor-1/YccA family protein [Prevotella sp. E13-17]UKK51636.1 Bax inhibitor-1/YccA family protein [Prevotella sp. E13-17]